VAENNKFQGKLTRIRTTRLLSKSLFLGALIFLLLGFHASNALEQQNIEPVQACMLAPEAPLNATNRNHIAECLGWEDTSSSSLCHGHYAVISLPKLSTQDEIHISADEVSLYSEGVSRLQGHVEVQDASRIVNAQTALIYRDAKTNKVNRIELLGNVHYREAGRLMVADKANIYPEDKSGRIENAVYRIQNNRSSALLPAWGRAEWVKRLANKDIWMHNVTYTTCAPKNRAWQIEAKDLAVDNAQEKVVAKHAILRVGDLPLMYTPYLKFSTSNKRESGFLIPQLGYSNVGGADVTLPYYWNIAPNYDATITPHIYSRRGVMWGSDFRFLTPHTNGVLVGNVLPKDQAFRRFIVDNQLAYPGLQGSSDNRWSILMKENTNLSDRLHLNFNYQQVSDDYYLQDFSTNLAVITDNQLLRQGELSYTTEHWLFTGLAQSYQTLHPINQSAVSNIYERLPQLSARANYDELPLESNLTLLGEYDQYHWPADNLMQPQGPRFHFEPTWSRPFTKPWGYVTPNVNFVQNYYNVHYVHAPGADTFNRSIPRYSVDSGLTFERYYSYHAKTYAQTLEPHLYYLYVPFHNQASVPVYDSAYMIFNYDQLFRNNRFSGFDRIGDANQLAYALTSRWLSDDTGQEKANFSIGQMRYFDKRRVQLCYQLGGNCVDDPVTLGYLSPLSEYSPIASRAMYQLSANWTLNGDYVYDQSTRSTYAGDVNLHYQPQPNHIVSLAYTYLGNGNVLQVGTTPIQDNALHQATLAYAWPFTEHWSGLGVYSYNLSKHYDMLTFLGLQYDNCCWAMRVVGGRTFMSLSPSSLLPEYNNNIYVQVLLKGLASVARGDPASTINTYLPGYHNIF
jgi:LPS-assembly protein